MCSLGRFLEVANSFEGVPCAWFYSFGRSSALCTRADKSDKRTYLSTSCVTLSRKHFVHSGIDLWTMSSGRAFACGVSFVDRIAKKCIADAIM